MAREHARIQTAIWIDDDFLDLTRDAQHLYFVMTTQMTLNFCGVTTWHAGRISQLAAGWTVAEVEDAAEELSQQLYLVIDETTGEVLVRSFIRNDGLLSSPNITKAMYRTYSDIGSRTLRSVVVHELKRLHAEQPLLKGWESCSDLLAKRSTDPRELPLFNPSRNPSINPFRSSFGTLTNCGAEPFACSLLPTPYSQLPYSRLPAAKQLPTRLRNNLEPLPTEARQEGRVQGIPQGIEGSRKRSLD